MMCGRHPGDGRNPLPGWRQAVRCVLALERCGIDANSDRSDSTPLIGELIQSFWGTRD